jgi:hypothetical protein
MKKEILTNLKESKWLCGNRYEASCGSVRPAEALS